MAGTMYGTSFFRSFEAACDYYAGEGCNAHDVRGKLDDGSISIGMPPVGPDEIAILHPTEGRYWVRPASIYERAAHEFAQRR